MIAIHAHVLEEIRSTLGTKTPECGGVLAARPGEPISRFYFDVSGVSKEASYMPDHETINEVLEHWANEGYQMVGMIHSHGNGGDFPSCGDLFYCEQILKGNPGISEFLLPIVTLNPFAIHVYRVQAKQKLHVFPDEFAVVSDSETSI